MKNNTSIIIAIVCMLLSLFAGAQEVSTCPYHGPSAWFPEEAGLVEGAEEEEEVLAPGVCYGEFLNDTFNGPNTSLKDWYLGLGESARTNVLEVWGKVAITRPVLRKDVAFLRKFSEILDDVNFNIHIFKGEIKITGGVPGAYSFKVSGIHHKDAIDGVKARIKTGTQTAPNTKGFYTAKVEMHHPANVNNGGWKSKDDTSSFFPDWWSKQTVQEEIAIAFNNKILLLGNKYKGTMSDGTELIMFIDGDKIISAFPIVN